MKLIRKNNFNVNNWCNFILAVNEVNQMIEMLINQKNPLEDLINSIKNFDEVDIIKKRLYECLLIFTSSKCKNEIYSFDLFE